MFAGNKHGLPIESVGTCLSLRHQGYREPLPRAGDCLQPSFPGRSLETVGVGVGHQEELARIRGHVERGGLRSELPEFRVLFTVSVRRLRNVGDLGDTGRHRR